MTPVRITASSGRITVIAEEIGDVVVETGQPHPMGGVLEVQGSSDGVRMRVPIGTDLVVGSHSGAVELRWDGRREDGSSAVAGMYFLRIWAGGRALRRKAILLR